MTEIEELRAENESLRNLLRMTVPVLRWCDDQWKNSPQRGDGMNVLDAVVQGLEEPLAPSTKPGKPKTKLSVRQTFALEALNRNEEGLTGRGAAVHTRTLESLCRKKLASRKLPRNPGKFRYFITDAGRAALAEKEQA